MTDVDVGLLGPVEVRAAGRAPTRLSPSVRALLARLALSPGRVVSVDTLTDALWGEDLPSDAGNALQLRVSKLRRALAAAGAGPGILVTRAPGYQLAVAAESIDAYRFPRLVEQAREAALRGDAAAALAAYDEALALWRGPALADVEDAIWAEAERTRLEELRLGAVEDRLELLLETGRASAAAADLERLVSEHPLRERPHRLLMLALYRGGRQADALAVYHRLRHRLADELGIDPGPDLQALAEAILRQQVDPALHVSHVDISRPADNLSATTAAPAVPPRLTSVIGRDGDLAAVLAILRDCRVVTLTGPGGVGKTTLALEAARHVDAALAEPVYLVRLATVPVGADVAEAVADQLGLGVGGPAAIDAVLSLLAPTRALLVIDNCEHVVDAVATFVERVVAAGPGVRVLATSREALAVAGETQVAVAPLAVPAETDDPATAAATPAVRLFVDRATAVRPDFRLDEAGTAEVAAICRELDGMPLAIELAAARVKALPPGQILSRLRDRFALLTGGPRTSEARHRTLRAVLDWSHDLLSEPERRLLRRLAVFHGGWTLAAAEEVCAFADIDAGDVVELLFRLVDRSLVVPDPVTGRFRLLVTVREYARARLEEAGELDTGRGRHLAQVTRLAEEFGPRVRFDEVARSRLYEEHDNLRAAMEHALRHAPADPAPGLRLAAALLWFWQYGPRFEGVRALRALLGTGRGSDEQRAHALLGLALLYVYYPTEASRAAARESLALFESLGDVRGAAMARLVIAWEGQYTGEGAQRRAMLVASRDALGDADHGWWRALSHYVEALLLLGDGAFAEAAGAWRQCIELLQSVGDRLMVNASITHLGVAQRGAGAADEALATLLESVAAARRLRSPHGLAFALVHLAHTRLDLDAHADVTAELSEADEVARSVHNPRCQAWAAWGRARVALAAGADAVAIDEGRQAAELLADGEFPWAREQLAEFRARVAGPRTT